MKINIEISVEEMEKCPESAKEKIGEFLLDCITTYSTNKMAEFFAEITKTRFPDSCFTQKKPTENGGFNPKPISKL